MTDRKHVKSTLIAIREAVNIAGTQALLADAAGCSQQTISDIMTGKRRLSAEIAIKISKATGVPAHALRPDLFEGAA
jgi:DNA-binding transcriptional regulator YdaS (Cro superfamily)